MVRKYCNWTYACYISKQRTTAKNLKLLNLFGGGWRDTSDAISLRHLLSKPRYVSMFPASCVSISNMVRCVFCGTINEKSVSEIEFMCDTVS